MNARRWILVLCALVAVGGLVLVLGAGSAFNGVFFLGAALAVAAFVARPEFPARRGALTWAGWIVIVATIDLSIGILLLGRSTPTHVTNAMRVNVSTALSQRTDHHASFMVWVWANVALVAVIVVGGLVAWLVRRSRPAPGTLVDEP